MNFEFTDEMKLMQSTMKKFVEKECLPLERELCYKDPDWVELPPEIHKEMVEKVKKAGLWALSAPEQYGGVGLDPLMMSVLRVEQAKTTIGTAHHNPFGGDPPGILYSCTDEQKERYLLPYIRGEKRSAMGNTEPGAGSDAAAISTSAVKQGDKWVLNGRKLFSTMADKADFVFITAVNDKEKRGRGGISMFIVDRDTPGFNVERHVEVIRPQYSTEIAIDNVEFLKTRFWVSWATVLIYSRSGPTTVVR